MTVSCGSFKKYFQKIFFISLLTLASWTKTFIKHWIFFNNKYRSTHLKRKNTCQMITNYFINSTHDKIR